MYSCLHSSSHFSIRNKSLFRSPNNETEATDWGKSILALSAAITTNDLLIWLKFFHHRGAMGHSLIWTDNKLHWRATSCLIHWLRLDSELLDVRALFWVPYAHWWNLMIFFHIDRLDIVFVFRLGQGRSESQSFLGITEVQLDRRDVSLLEAAANLREAFIWDIWHRISD